MKMDRRKSLVFGFRTGRNVLKGKNIRKSDDGVHNFDDYWTDSGSESTEESISRQTQQSPSISDARFATLRQSVRKSKDSNVSHSPTEIRRRLDRSELTKSPSKSVKSNISSSDKDVNKSVTNKQILSPKRQQGIQRHSIRNLRNKSITDNLGSHDDVESNVSNSIQHSTSNVSSIRGQTENTAVSQNRETNDEVVNIIVTQNNVQSSENVDKEECIQSRTSRHSRHSVRDQSTSCQILHNSSEKVKETSVTPKKRRSSRNLTLSFRSLQNSTSDANFIGKYAEDTISPLSKKSNKMKKTFVMQENVPDANLNNSDIHILSKSKVTYNAIDSDDGFESEINPLSDKSFNGRNKGVGVREQVSNTFTTSFGNRTVKKMRNSLQVAKVFAKYDEYDAEIMQMIRENGQNLRASEKKFSVETNPVEQKKTKTNASKNPIKSTEESYDQIALERGSMSSNKSQNSHNSRSSKRIQIRSQLKSSEFGDGIIEELSRKSRISEKGNSEVANISLTSQHNYQSQTEHDLSSNSEQKSERSLRRKSSEVKSALKRKSTVMSITSAKKHITESQNMPHSRLNISAGTFPKPVSECGAEKGNSEVTNISLTSQHNHQSQTEHDLSLDSEQKLESSSKVDKKGQLRAEERSLGRKSSAVKSASKRKSVVISVTSAKKHSTEHQNVPHSRLNISAEIPKPVSESGTETDEANGIRIDEANISHTDEFDDEALNFDSRRKLVNKSNEKLKASETFIKDNIKSAVDIPEVGNETMSKRDNKRKKHVNKSNEKVKTLEYISKDKIKSASKLPRVKNKATPSLNNKKKKHVNEDYENIPENGSDELESSPGKKKNKKKTTVRSDSVSLRRSSRQKFPRLASWRQERLQFRVENGIINFVGIDAGTAEDDGAIKQLMHKMKKNKAVKKRKADPKDFELDDVVQKKKVRVPVVKRFRSTPWDKGYRGDECPYRIKKLFETRNSASGFIQIDINEAKPIQYMPDEDLNLTVMKGKVQVTVQDNIIVAEEKDMFMIPRCIPYSLKNVGLTNALLVFCVSKFQYLESRA